MKYSQYITEMESAKLEPITITIGSSDFSDSLNQELYTLLSDNFSSAESGFEAIRKIFGEYGGDVPVIDGLDPEGDEIALDVNTPDGPLILYVIYSLTDDDEYEFYAELTDDEGLEEIISEDEEEDEEEED